MAQRDREKKLDMIGKLLIKAERVAGTPEADVFDNHAFGLLAKYGIERAHDPALERDAVAIVRHDFPVEGEFLPQRIALLSRIATALHCAYAYWLFSPTAATVEVYGAQGHIDRVQALYEPLLARMFRQAMASPWSPSSGLSLQDHRVSWMQGFTLSIRARLEAAEAEAAANADDRSGTDVHAHAFAADAERAEAAKKRALPVVRRSTYNPTLSRDSLAQGYRAGKGAGPKDGGRR